MDKSSWTVDYQKEFPIIKLKDCVGKDQIIDVNEIVLKERGKLAIKTLEMINKLMESKQ